MTDYRELAAAELAKVQAVNDEFAARARTVREDRQAAADAMEAMVTETPFRLAEDYIALAALERDARPPAAVPRSQADADEFAAAERGRET